MTTNTPSEKEQLLRAVFEQVVTPMRSQEDQGRDDWKTATSTWHPCQDALPSEAARYLHTSASTRLPFRDLLRIFPMRSWPLLLASDYVHRQLMRLTQGKTDAAADLPAYHYTID
jgi:hypothetical protein